MGFLGRMGIVSHGKETHRGIGRFNRDKKSAAEKERIYHSRKKEDRNYKETEYKKKRHEQRVYANRLYHIRHKQVIGSKYKNDPYAYKYKR